MSVQNQKSRDVGDYNCRLKGRVFVVKRCCFEV
jgi:hypothetical protein